MTAERVKHFKHRFCKAQPERVRFCFCACQGEFSDGGVRFRSGGMSARPGNRVLQIQLSFFGNSDQGTLPFDAGEDIFYNGYENEYVPPFPRPPLEVEITEMRFE